VAGDGSFSSPDVRSGTTYQHTFATAGTFTYFCDIHPGMTATISVAPAPGQPAPPADPSPTATTTPGAPDTAAAPGDVTIADFSFTPGSITIAAGQSLTFVNTGRARHSATAADGSFDTGTLAGGASKRIAFPKAGTFPYFCIIHPDMKGTVLVTGADGAPPPPAVAKAPVAAGTGDIQMVDFSFSPGEITVAAGGSVNFVNNGVAPHTATARDGSFDSGVVAPGSKYRATFANPGTFTFFCTIHPQMTGKILVVGADGAPPPAEAPAAAPVAPPVPAPKNVAVTVRADKIDPISVRVAESGTVTWNVEGLGAHMIEADDGTFSSGLVYQTKSFKYTFTTVGTWKYHDSLAGSTGFEVVVVPGPAAGDPGSTADGKSAAVNIADQAFAPNEVTVVKGAKVTWTNSDAAAHTVAAKDQSWSSDLLPTGATFDHVFDTPGRFEYVCTLHPNMTGTIVVTEASGALAAPTPAATTGTPTAAKSAPALSAAGGSLRSIAIAALAGLLLCIGAFVVGHKTRRPRPVLAAKLQ
jgi:plastocyanin